jgi:hypothetical protein
MDANNLSGATADDGGRDDVSSPFMEILRRLYPLVEELLGHRNSAASWFYRRSFA